MKKLVLSLALVCVAQFGMAQDSYKSDVIEVIELSTATTVVAVIVNQILPMIPEEKQADFKREFEATLPSLYEKKVPIYQKYFTHEEIKEMLKFYKSPLGKKIAENAQNLASDGMKIGEDWGMEIQSIMMKYMQ